MTKRVPIIVMSVAAVAVVLILVLASSGASGYRVDAIFDSAEGIVPGQLVKIAGARAGTITAVRLQNGATPTAQLQLDLNARYGPFHTDAHCQILPEGPISEYFVECDPGSTSAPVLRAPAGSNLPTVALRQTSVPVSLQQVIDIFSLPVSERLGVLIDELGIGTAGNGANLNAILERANPALQQGDRVLSILDAQNTAIATAVDQSNQVIGTLAAHANAVHAFVDRAAQLSQTTAAHRDPLAQAVQKLPGLLGHLQTDLAPLDRVAQDGTPLLADLRAAAPGLTELTTTLPTFARLGTPAAQAVSRAAAQGNRTIPLAQPIVADLKAFVSTARRPGLQLAQLLTSTRDKGGFEGALHLLYALATDSSAYDSTSHAVAATISVFPQCLFNAQASGCSHAYGQPDYGQAPVNASGSTSPLSKSKIRSLLDYLLR